MACETCGYAQRWPRPLVSASEEGHLYDEPQPCPDDYHFNVERRAKIARWSALALAVGVVTVYGFTLTMLAVYLPLVVTWGVLALVAWPALFYLERRKPWKHRLPALALWALSIVYFIHNL